MSLDALPAELVHNIVSFLPYTSALALSWTSRKFYTCIDQSLVSWAPSTRLDVILDLLILEQWPPHSRLLACCFCHKLRPKNCFTLRQLHRYEKDKYKIEYMLKAQEKLRDRITKGKPPMLITRTRPALVTSQTDLSVELAGRLCIACGVREERYHRGEQLHFLKNPDEQDSGDPEDHGTGIVCKLCGTFKVCEPESRACALRMCWDCLAPTPGFHDKMFKYDLVNPLPGEMVQ